jgi:hypothetical protein
MPPTSPLPHRLAKALPYLFIVSLYIATSLWLRSYWPGLDWQHFLTAAYVLAEGRTQSLSSDGTVHEIDRLHVYSLRAQATNVGSIVLPHGPIAVMLMAPFVALCVASGATASFAAMNIIPWLPFLLFDILAALELRKAVRRLCPRLGERTELFVFALYLTCWATFFTSPYHAHFESVLIYFLLVAIRMQADGRDVLAGFLFGLGYLTKPTAALAILAQCAILIASRQWRRAVLTLALSVGISLVVLSPFLIADTKNVLYMIFGATQDLPIAYMNIWYGIFGQGAQPEFVVRWINLIGLIVAAGLAGCFAWRRRIQLGTAANYGLVALLAVAALSLVKWGSLHYYLMPFAILLVWDVAANALPWISITYVGVLSNIFILWLSYETKPIAGFGARPPGIEFGWQSAWIMIALFAGTVIYLSLRLGRERAPAEWEPTGRRGTGQ